MKNKETKLRYRDTDDFIELIGRRWRGAILACLCEEGPKRFSELKSELKPVTSKVLIKELRYLQANLMISCEKNTAAQNSTLYFMTEHGLTITPVIYTIQDWSLIHRKLILKKFRE